MELDKYTIGQARSIEELAQGVNQMIAKGWTAVGGVTVAQVLGLEGPETIYLQAMGKPKSQIVIPRR